MANITPNSTIILLHNCPLDTTYDHTIYFTNATDQYNYFSSLAKITRTEYSYVRKDRGLQIEVPVGVNLYDCNYMMFRNASFENKWFYAFVTKVEYVNNVTWYIEFQLDVMQTWLFDYQIESCFIDREHSATDEIGENLLEEPVALGEYVSNGIEHCTTTEGDDQTSYLRNLSLIFACTFNNDTNLTDYDGGYYGGLYTGLNYITFDLPTQQSEISQFVTDVTTFLQHVASLGKPEGIITCYVAPKVFTRGSDTTPTPQQFTKKTTFSKIYETDDSTPSDPQYYLPRNKKLYTFPYNFLYATNFQGESVAYMYEYFTDPTNAIFEINGVMSPDPDVILTPMNYKGVKGTEGNFDERLVLGGFPQIPFATNVFEAWVAQSAKSTLISSFATNLALAGAGVLLMGTGAGAPIGAGMVGMGIANMAGTTGQQLALTGQTNASTPRLTGSVSSGSGGSSINTGAIMNQARYEAGAMLKENANVIGQLMGSGYQHSIAPPSAHTGAGSTTMASLRLLDFGFMRKHIRVEYAERIDQFFDMFGYSTKRVKVPNRAVRKHWTYTKTVGCCIKGSVPASDMASICAIYDHGITFWKNGAEVGNYSLAYDNTPMT